MRKIRLPIPARLGWAVISLEAFAGDYFVGVATGSPGHGDYWSQINRDEAFPNVDAAMGAAIIRLRKRWSDVPALAGKIDKLMEVWF